jgi:hypothetical protein
MEEDAAVPASSSPLAERLKNIDTQLSLGVKICLSREEPYIRCGFNVWCFSLDEVNIVSDFVKRVYGGLDNIDTTINVKGPIPEPGAIHEFPLIRASAGVCNGLSYDQRQIVAT